MIGPPAPRHRRGACRCAGAGGLRKIDFWTARRGVAEVEWPAEPRDPFFNANRPDDLAAVEAIPTGDEAG